MTKALGAKGRKVAKRQTGRKVTAKSPVKRRSAAAAALASPSYHKRVVKSAKAYRRKTKKPTREGDDKQNG